MIMLYNRYINCCIFCFTVAPKVSGDWIPRDIIAKKGQPFKIAIPYNGNPIPTTSWSLVRFSSSLY